MGFLVRGVSSVELTLLIIEARVGVAIDALYSDAVQKIEENLK